MNGYLWETHLHTAETSLCATDTAADMMAACHAAGYQGVVVTDHFLNGYSAARRAAPWPERIAAMTRGYRAARAAGDALGMVVLFGWEYTDQGADYLTYGLDEAFLLAHPALMSLTLEAYVDLVHAHGGFITQAHPYREADYLPDYVAKRWDIVDAIEVFNGSHNRNERMWDDRALALAQAHDMIESAGSDAHCVADVGTAGLLFPMPIQDAETFVAAMRARQGVVVRMRK